MFVLLSFLLLLYICYYYYICQPIAESFSHRTCPPERKVLNSNQGLGGDGRDLSSVRVAIYDTGCLFFLLFLFFLLPARDRPFCCEGPNLNLDGCLVKIVWCSLIIMGSAFQWW